MALDATIGGASADTYATLAEFQTYAFNMGWTVTGAAPNIAEAALRRARLYLDASYSWVGVKATQSQALQWPRSTSILVDGYSVATDTIPQAIKDAQCELAYLIQAGTDPLATISQGALSSITETVVGAVSRSKTFAAGTERDRAAFPAVDALVGPYVTGKAGARSGSISMVRA